MEVLRMHAVSRLALNRDISNIQVAWVKEGMKLAQVCLAAGANDLGGTLINESISTAAGAGHGQLTRPREMRRVIRAAGRIPAERSTLYGILHRFDQHDESALDPLDRVNDEDAGRFGSYHKLIASGKFRFKEERPRAAQLKSS